LELDFLEIINSERNGVQVMLGIHVWRLGGKANNSMENGGNKKKVEIWGRGELVLKINGGERIKIKEIKISNSTCNQVVHFKVLKCDDNHVQLKCMCWTGCKNPQGLLSLRMLCGC
jgi:hypothetical protein